MSRHFISAVRFCSYTVHPTVHRTQYDRSFSDSNACCCRNCSGCL